MKKKRVLFICTHNACRSQMAEGLLNSLYGGRYEAYSAGTEPSTVNPYSIRVMDEIGIDISKHSSKSLKTFMGQEFYSVVTVCDSAKQTCPVFPGAAKKLYWDLKDPSGASGSQEEILSIFRKTRDQIKDKIVGTFN